MCAFIQKLVAPVVRVKSMAGNFSTGIPTMCKHISSFVIKCLGFEIDSSAWPSKSGRLLGRLIGTGAGIKSLKFEFIDIGEICTSGTLLSLIISKIKLRFSISSFILDLISPRALAFAGIHAIDRYSSRASFNSTSTAAKRSSREGRVDKIISDMKLKWKNMSCQMAKRVRHFKSSCLIKNG